jgi:phosphate transport system substrate-binding protein
VPQPATVLKGAGATFPYPVYTKWLTNYRRENPNVEIIYDSIGSEAGVRRLLAGDVDFGASLSPEAVHQFVPAKEDKYLLFPSVVGTVVPVVNLPGLSSDIAFTPEALAGIYLGKIKKWNDPVLRQANRGVHLPDLDIVVVHRSDGSGTSYAWSDSFPRRASSGKLKSAPGWLPSGQSAGPQMGMKAWPTS